MNYLALAALLFSAPSPALASDDFVSAQCQVKLLKVTTDALLKEFPAEASQADYFGQVTFNYGMKGAPRTVFFGPKLNESSKRCLVQVYTKLGAESKDSCPDYIYSHIDSNCR